MTGMNAKTGTSIAAKAHLFQSIRDILMTPIGSRVMRREYGSRLLELIDAPLNEETLIEIYTATAEAIRLWEPRVEINKVAADRIESGKIALTLEMEYIASGEKITMEGLSL
jgi:phage baseplate assembly protein W